MFHKFSLIWSWFVWLTTFAIPDFPLSMRYRGWLYSFGMFSCGNNFQVASSCRLISVDTLSVGDDVYFAPNVVVNGGGKIDISNEVMVGIGSVIVSGNHSNFEGSYRWGKRNEAPITVGEGSWLGANTVLVAGSAVPRSSLIAAGSVVVTVLLKPGVYGGVPARLLR